MKKIKYFEYLIIILLFINFSSCSNGENIIFGTKRVLRSEIKQSGGLHYFDGKPFSGIGFDMWDENITKIEVSFKKGKINGTAKKYYRDGTLEESIELKDGKKNGKRIEYWKNGNIQQVSNYDNDVLNGEYISYFENGQVKYKIKYLMGRRDGKEIEYNENGKIIKEYTYKNGDRIENFKE